MKILLTNITALSLFRQSEALHSSRSRSSCATALIPEKPPTPRDLEDLNNMLGHYLNNEQTKGLRPHVLISNPRFSRSSKNFKVHVIKAKLPGNCVVNFNSKIAVVSPELLLASFAQKSSFLELIYLISEMCSNFIHQDNELGIKVIDSPITNIDKIRKFFIKNQHIRGAKKILKCCQFACQNAMSPMEIKLFMRMTLPVRMGGYGFKDISLNPTLNAELMGRLVKTTVVRKPDLLIRVNSARSKYQYVALEYNGDFHKNQVISDSLRANELVALGIRSFTVWNTQYGDIDYMDKLARTLAKCVGTQQKDINRRVSPDKRVSRLHLLNKLRFVEKNFN